MAKVSKTKAEIAREIALTGTYTPVYCEGDYLVANRLKNLNNYKRPRIYKILRVIHPYGDGEPSYRLWSPVEGKHRSELCSVVDIKYRKLADLESAVFLD